MTARERRKGAVAELEVVKLVQAAGWPHAHRNFQSGAQGGSDIAAGPAGTCIEVKNQKRICLPMWWQQVSDDSLVPNDLPVLAIRLAGTAKRPAQWLAVLELDELLVLMAARELT